MRSPNDGRVLVFAARDVPPQCDKPLLAGGAGEQAEVGARRNRRSWLVRQGVNCGIGATKGQSSRRPGAAGPASASSSFSGRSYAFRSSGSAVGPRRMSCSGSSSHSTPAQDAQPFFVDVRRHLTAAAPGCALYISVPPTRALVVSKRTMDGHLDVIEPCVERRAFEPKRELISGVVRQSDAERHPSPLERLLRELPRPAVGSGPWHPSTAHSHRNLRRSTVTASPSRLALRRGPRSAQCHPHLLNG